MVCGPTPASATTGVMRSYLLLESHKWVQVEAGANTGFGAKPAVSGAVRKLTVFEFQPQ